MTPQLINNSDVHPETKISTCFCGNDIEYTPALFNGVEMFVPTVCSDCVAEQQAQQAIARSQMANARLLASWDTICPPLYQTTEIGRLSPAFRKIVETWEIQPKAPKFIGRAGICKTRAAFLLMKRHHMSGVECCAISSARFAKMAADQFDDDRHYRAKCREVLEIVRTCGLLLLDDLGKQKMSERAEVELFDLLEYRSSNCLPTIWTANATGNELLKMFSPDRGEPILRRLAEFSL